MGFYEHFSNFAGKEVRDFQAGETIDPQQYVYRIRVDYDSEIEGVDLLQELLSAPEVEQLTGLIIGAWASEMAGDPPDAVNEALVAAADRLPQLKALFLGEMTEEENEVSWIVQTDVSPILAAFPRLEELWIRGSQGLSLGSAPAHGNLRKLVIECGGLPRNVVQELGRSQLPQIEHLELYLGTDEYGWDGEVGDLAPILSGKLFPQLKYLGLRDSSIADDVATAVAAAPIVERLETLDLSLGTLGDAGAEALLASSRLLKLKRLDLHHNYISPPLAGKLEALPIEVDTSERLEEDVYGGTAYRYCAISE